MKVLDLFSGIGGFSLGLERAGMETVAFCEIDAKARKVLKKHWPNVPIHEDIKKLAGEHIGYVDVICGGFPCQDVSIANVNYGAPAGLNGARSGLWSEYKRLIDEIRPRYAIIENVSALRSRGLDIVLGQLAEIGYDAEWHCIPAARVGAPHRRDRIWIVAYPCGSRREGSLTLQCLLEPAFAALAKHGYPAFDSWRALVGGKRMVRGRDGLPLQLERDRLKQFGNSVVPQIPQLIGEAIMFWEALQ